jgi:hypothetical protein
MSTNLQLEFLLQFRKKKENLAILASNKQQQGHEKKPKTNKHIEIKND